MDDSLDRWEDLRTFGARWHGLQLAVVGSIDPGGVLDDAVSDAPGWSEDWRFRPRWTAHVCRHGRRSRTASANISNHLASPGCRTLWVAGSVPVSDAGACGSAMAVEKVFTQQSVAVPQ